MSLAITLAHLTKRFGSFTAVDDVSLEIATGELFFLLGPSGCGKTTLLRILAGLEVPDAGTLTTQGRPVLVFQSYALWPHMTVAEHLAFSLDAARVPRATHRQLIDEALTQVHLQALAQRKPGELSGGQQQRVALARALVVKPQCLLLDEPLSNLDTALRTEMRAEIQSLCRESHITALCVTHDQKEALAIADRIAVMQAGRIVQVGTPFELYHAPCNEFVDRFIGEVTTWQGQRFRPEELMLTRGGAETIATVAYQGASVAYTLASGTQVLTFNPQTLYQPGDAVTVCPTHTPIN